MDPFTALLNAFAAVSNAVAANDKLRLAIFEGMDAPTRAKYGEVMLADAQREREIGDFWYGILAQFKPKVTNG